MTKYTIDMSSKMLPIITEEIANLEVSKNTYYKTQFCLPIYKDLQSVLQWRDNVERSMSLYPFYTEQYKTELLMWYRKLMEHFYYTFLLKDLPEE